MKRFVSLLTAFLMSVLILPFAAFAMDGSLAHFTTDREALTFVDVSSGDWFAPYVQGVSKAGLMIGVGEDRFAPEADITLAEVYTVTARIHAIYHTGSAEAADGYDNREDKPWFYGYVKYCMDCGIMPGEPGDVTQPAFRIECATLLSRALPEDELLPINEVADNAIPNLPSSRDTENVYRLYRAGVLTGMDDKGTFQPESKVRRCEVAAIVTRLIDPTLRRTVTGLTDPANAEEPTFLYEFGSYKLELPVVYQDRILINPEDEPNRSPDTILSIYMKQSYTEGMRMGFPSGLICSIQRYDQGGYEQYLTGGDWTTQFSVARDDQGYYILSFSADRSVSQSDEETYSQLYAWCRQRLPDVFISLNSLSGYSDDEFWTSAETYHSAHKYYKYYPYRAYPDAATEEDPNLYYTIMLSQPATQGEKGIWCVERFYDDPKYGYIYAVFPNSDGMSAVEIYENMQSSCDAGQDVYLTDPLEVALRFVKDYFGHTEATHDSFEETDNVPEGNYHF